LTERRQDSFACTLLGVFDSAAISRHKRVGRIEERDGKLYAT
jgi:hypothetical protein